MVLEGGGWESHPFSLRKQIWKCRSLLCSAQFLGAEGVVLHCSEACTYIYWSLLLISFFLCFACPVIEVMTCYSAMHGWGLTSINQRKSFLVNAIFIKPAQSASETPREMETYLNFWGLEIILQILYKNIENNYYLAAQFWNIWAHALFFWRSLILYRYELGMASKDDISCDPTALPKLVSRDLLGSNELQCLSNLQIFNTFPHKVMMKTREASL